MRRLPRVDHVRHAALLYAILVGLIAWAIITRPMDMFGVAFFFPLAAMLGIVADYSVLRRRRRDAASDAAPVQSV